MNIFKNEEWKNVVVLFQESSVKVSHRPDVLNRRRSQLCCDDKSLCSEHKALKIFFLLYINIYIYLVQKDKQQVDVLLLTNATD